MTQTQATTYTTRGLTIEIHPKADKEDDDNKWKGSTTNAQSLWQTKSRIGCKCGLYS
jgi:hypothetical protein